MTSTIPRLRFTVRIPSSIRHNHRQRLALSSRFQCSNLHNGMCRSENGLTHRSCISGGYVASHGQSPRAVSARFFSSSGKSTGGGDKSTKEEEEARVLKEIDEVLRQRKLAQTQTQTQSQPPPQTPPPPSSTHQQQHDKKGGNKSGGFYQNAKPQLINVAASFAVLVLAMQVVESKMKFRKLKKEMNHQEKAREEIEMCVDELKSKEFALRLADALILDKERGGSAEEKTEEIGLWRRLVGARPNSADTIASPSSSALDTSSEVIYQSILKVFEQTTYRTAKERKEDEQETLRQYQRPTGQQDKEYSSNSIKGIVSEEEDGLHPAARELVKAVEGELTSEEGDAEAGGSGVVVRNRKYMF